MGLFSRIFRRARARTQTVQFMTTEAGSQIFGWNGQILESDQVASAIEPFFSAVGKLRPRHVRRNSDGSIESDPVPHIRRLLAWPNPTMSAQELQERLAISLILNRNAFAVIDRDPMGSVSSIWPVSPAGVSPVTLETGRLGLCFTLVDGARYSFDYADVIHIRSFLAGDGLFGEPLAPALAPLMEVVATTDQGIVAAIKNSALVRWLLKFSNALRPEDLKRQARDFADNYLSTSEGLGVAAIDAKAEAIQIKPTDYVPNAATMDRTTERIHRLFNTNESIVTSSFTAEEWQSYFDSQIEPVAMKLSAAWTRRLFSNRELGFGNEIVFESNAWDAASMQTKLELAQMVDRGAMTPNEWRQAFNLGPIEGGDEPIRRLDTAPVEGEPQGEPDAEPDEGGEQPSEDEAEGGEDNAD